MQPVKILHIKASISKIRYIGEGKLCVVDENNSVRIFELSDFKLVDGFRIKLPKNNPLENSIDISSNGKYIAIAIRGKHKATVWDVESKKLIYTLGWHKGDIISLSFDREEKYLMSGGEDGRAYIWSMATGKMVSSMPPHADYITSVAFSKNCLWGATGSYDKSVTITNISSMEISYRKRVHKGAVTFLKFLNKQRLLSGDKSGELVMWNYAKGRVEKRLASMLDMIFDIAVDGEEQYAFVISNTIKKVALYNLDTYEQITDEFIKMLEQPIALEFVPETNYIVVGTIDGGIYFYDLYEDEKKLKEYITAKDYENAYELVSGNPFLKHTETFKKLEAIWEKTLQQAQSLFEKGEMQAAKQILAPFLKIPAKRTFIQSLMHDFNEFEKFKTAVIKGKYPLAYSLVAQYPYLKNTVYYKKMEEVWRKTFNKAKALIMQRGKDDEVREILMPFRGVTEKTPFIQTLFNQKQLYQLLTLKLAKKDFKEFFNLISRFPFLADSEEYQKAVLYGENLIKKANELFKKGEYKKVLNIAEMLENFPKYKEEAKELAQHAKVLIEFHRILATKDYNLIEKFVKEYPFLEDVEDYQKIEKEFREKLQEAEYNASNGEVKPILEKLKDYMDVEEKRYKIGQLVKSAYLQQIISLLVKAFKGSDVAEKIINGIKNYIKIFGFDMEISDLVEKAKKLKIKVNVGGIPEGGLNKWHLFKLPEHIWEDVK